MTEHVSRIGVDPDEPAVRSEGLRAFVEAARSQPSQRLKIDAATVTQAWQQRRASHRRMLGIAVAAGLGTLAIAGWYGQRSTVEASPTELAAAPAEAAPDPGATPAVPAVVPALALADTIEVTALQGRPAPEYRVEGPFALALDRGVARLAVEPSAALPLRVALPDGVLEVHAGVTVVQVAGDGGRVQVDVQQGRAFRIERDGTRSELTATTPTEPIEPTAAAPPTKTLGAAELAELAEARLAKGDRAGAIKYLQKLVRTHPRAAAARTGLLDLGRLLHASGQDDAARCAYREFLARHPDSSLVDEVERALARVGDEGGCNGLTPR